MVPDNSNCAELNPDFEELRVNAPADGTFTDGTLSVTIDVRNTASGPVFDWTSNLGVDAVVVKGGDDGNAFVYDPPSESKGDTGLHSPVNPNNNQFFGLSHISFCYDITPSIKVEKSGDTLSKIGDSVTYNFKVTNDGDIPLTLTSISDSVLGDLADDAPAACDSLAPGAFCTFSVGYTIQSGDPDPLANTVTVNYGGTLNNSAVTATDTDTHSVNLFQPSVEVVKSGPATAAAGQSITYNFTINKSSSDSPNLIMDSITDTVLGNLADDAPAACDSLASGNSCTFRANHTVQATPDPLVNTVTVHYHPSGFPNHITDTDDHSLDVTGDSEGCTLGYWKNHTKRWGGRNGDDVTTTIQRTDLFNATMGVTSAQSGLSNSKTLLAAVKLGGGGKLALARHAAAALASADANNVAYPYTVEEVIALYRDAVGADPGPETVASAHLKLEAANQSGCPLN